MGNTCFGSERTEVNQKSSEDGKSKNQKFQKSQSPKNKVIKPGSIEEKIEFLDSLNIEDSKPLLTNFRNGFLLINGIKISKDSKYIFTCKFQVGKLYQGMIK